MLNIETIWHHLLNDAISNNNYRHTQKDISKNLGYSLSTVNLAINRLSDVGAVVKSGKYFNMADIKKLLYYWATHRKLDKDIMYKTHSNNPILEIEGLTPPSAIIGGYTAAKYLLSESPSDYSKVYFYDKPENLEDYTKRFPPKNNKGENNIFVVKAHPILSMYGKTTTISQTFVDIWGMSDWYSRDFITSLEEEIEKRLAGNK